MSYLEKNALKKIDAYLESLQLAHALPETTTIIREVRSIIKEMMAEPKPYTHQEPNDEPYERYGAPKE